MYTWFEKEEINTDGSNVFQFPNIDFECFKRTASTVFVHDFTFYTLVIGSYYCKAY